MSDITDVKYFSLKKLTRFVAQIRNDKKAIKELTKLVLGDDLTLSMRASWALVHVSYKNPKIIYSELPALVKFLKGENQHTGAIRNVLNLLNELDIPEKHCSEIFDLCMKFTKNATLPHAVRAFAITILGQICQRYPELKPEVELVLNELKTFPQPPSITVRIRDTSKILLKL
jgi:hypothetical protein